MVLVIGGAYSGRRAFAEKIAGNLSSNGICYVSASDSLLFSSELEGELSDKKFSTQVALSRVVERLSSFPIVIATELGCGIVPVSEADLKLREANGKLNQALAKIADTVVLMNAGIPQFIKGEEISSVKFDASSFAVVFRHGQTESNLLKRSAGGLSNVPLTELGVQQAKDTKSKMEELFAGYYEPVKNAILNPKRIFVSPMVRAQDTAKILYPDAEIVTVDDICEMKMGLFENMTYEELSSGKFADGSVSEENAAIYQKWIDSNGTMACPSSKELIGESIEIFAERSLKAFMKIRSMLEENELPILVAHGGIQKSVCSQAFKNKTCGARVDYWQSDNAMFRFGELK